MDGTLVDSSAVVEQVWGEFAAEFGLRVADILAVSHGRQAVDTIREFLPEGADARAIAAGMVAKEEQRLAGIVEIPGGVDFVRSLPQDRVGLVTSAPRGLALLRMRAAGFDTPAVRVFAEDIERGKPAPDAYLLGAERLGIDPAELLVFEDAPAGIASGLAAGAQVVVVGRAAGEHAHGLPGIPDYRGLEATFTADGRIELRLE
ncbi:HAD-IA family hydrolase [Galbitalea soli]|uniref:HAD-IA family hydrolase n=2 Tax=Galbitalea soli TaxID=1268042 RepID=A0A7C9PMC4_9MICO|nr:HAD-IA family hydrolase [Galbitalea soli]NEM90707.1 HAD-IA family hydrolase [Galbitalea soli]